MAEQRINGQCGKRAISRRALQSRLLPAPSRPAGRFCVRQAAGSIAGSIAAVLILAGLGGCASSGTVSSPPGVERYADAVNDIAEGNEDAALEKLNEALAANPELRMAHMKLGEIYRERGKIDAALPHYQALSELDPYTYTNHYYLGLSFQLLNRLQESAKAYLAAINLQPQDFKSNMNLGLVYYGLGDYDAATNYIERATRIDPDDAMAWSNLGVVMDAKGSAVLAEAAYRRSLEMSGNKSATLTNLVANLLTQNKPDEAVTVASNLVRTDPQPQHYKRLADAATMASQWTLASEAYDKAISLQPNYRAAMNGKATMLIRQYDTGLRLNDSLRQQAVSLWEKSLALDPAQPDVSGWLEQWKNAPVISR